MRTAALAASAGIRGYMSTLDFQGVFADRSIDPIYPSAGPRIYVFWHEYILVPLYLRGHCDLTMLLSRHRDADILFHLAHHMGFECVRGSSFSGGTAALIELERAAKTMHLTITPDGPRGPRRRLSQGPVYLASRLGIPIVAMGLGMDRPWRLRSWDRFAVPRPGSRVRAFVSGEIRIPAGLDRAGVESHRLQVEQILNGLCDDAEEWATSGAPRTDGVAARRRSQFDRAGLSWDSGPRGVDRTPWGGEAIPAPPAVKLAA
jgi:lysophospholipid acyltransferase (LPLAT)-like uncharacterized protein